MIRYCLENKLVVGLVLAAFIVGGIAVAPFDWQSRLLPRE